MKQRYRGKSNNFLYFEEDGKIVFVDPAKMQEGPAVSSYNRNRADWEEDKRNGMLVEIPS
jgi:hypothetical protein